MKNSKQFYIDWLKETAAKFKSGEIGPETWAYTYLDDEYFLLLGFEAGFDEEPLNGEISIPGGYRLCFSLRKDTGQYFKIDEEFVEDYDYAYVEGDDELTINGVLEVYKKMFTFDEKKILARYLINDWNFDGTAESEELLQEAIDKAREADANDRPVRWTSTPSIEADELLNRVL